MTAAKTKRRMSDGTAGRRPRKRARDLPSPSHGDLISDLPDAILGSIIYLLPTKDGARTQAISRRWCPLWRSAPLNLDAHDICLNKFKLSSIVSSILRDHPGPARRFSFNHIRLHKPKKKLAEDAAQIESWFFSSCLRNLQELDISFEFWGGLHASVDHYQLPLPSMIRLAPTLLVARIGMCKLPSDIAAPSLNSPLLRKLTLWLVSISEEAIDVLLSACHVLEALFLQDIHDVGRLHISSPTLRIISFSATLFGREELVVDDVPRLERLLCRGVDCETIQINKAPKLKVLGPLSPHVSKIRIANLVFQGRIPPSLGHSICTVNILALKFSGPDLKAILGVLSCFPCLEKLYVIWDIYLKAKMKNLHQYDPLNPVKCLESHLKVLVLKNYTGGEEEVGFAKFFVLNARVVKEINFAVCDTIAIDKNWMTDQLRLLQVEARASQDARLKFRSGYSHLQTNYVNSSDLSIADPFS